MKVNNNIIDVSKEFIYINKTCSCSNKILYHFHKSYWKSKKYSVCAKRVFVYPHVLSDSSTKSKSSSHTASYLPAASCIWKGYRTVMIGALQRVKEKLKRFSELQVGNEAVILVMPVRCSNHWVTRTPGEKGCLAWFFHWVLIKFWVRRVACKSKGLGTPSSTSQKSRQLNTWSSRFFSPLPALNKNHAYTRSIPPVLQFNMICIQRSK